MTFLFSFSERNCMHTKNVLRLMYKNLLFTLFRGKNEYKKISPG